MVDALLSCKKAVLIVLYHKHMLKHQSESTGASMERTKMPNLRNGSKRGFEPGLARLRVRHSTAELALQTR